DLAGDRRDTLTKKLLNVGLLLAQHRDCAARVEAADHNVDAVRAELSREVERARELVRLDADETHEKLRARAAAPADDFIYRKSLGGFIVGDDLDVDVAQRAAPLNVVREAVKNVQRVAWQNAFPEADHIAVVVVLGRLDQDDAKFIEVGFRLHGCADGCKLPEHDL